MRQLISRPTIYTVIGLGVSALLFSQMRSGEPLASNQISASDPFKSLGDLSGKDLIGSVDAMPAVVQGMERDTVTALKSIPQTLPQALPESLPQIEELAAPLQDLAAELPAFQETAAEAVAALVAPMDNELTKLEFNETDFPAFDDENTTTANVATTDRYDIGKPAAEVPEIVPEMATMVLVDEITQNAAQDRSRSTANSIGRVTNNAGSQPRGWRKNPFINESKDVVASEPMLDTESANVDSMSFNGNSNFDQTPVQGATTILEGSEMDNQFSIEFDSPEQVSPVANFESQNAGSSVVSIPSNATEMPSVVTSYDSQPNGNLATVVGLPDSVAHKAVHNIEYGKSLSRRGAAYAARQEFYAALRILAQAHDSQAGGTAYTLALRDGIVALQEAEDFIVSDTESQIGLNVAAVIEGHATKIISQEQAANMTPIEAMQRYFAFSSHQMRLASGQNPVAAEALYCLGKLHTVQAKFGASPSKLDIAKAIVFHQSAIASDSSNYRSSNELGVLLANSGRLNEAQQMLKRSLQIQQLPQTWQNLAVVHQRGGQQQLAHLAYQEYLLTSEAKAVTNNAQGTIRWIEPGEFNQGTPLELRQRTAELQPAPGPPAESQKPSIAQRLKSFF